MFFKTGSINVELRMASPYNEELHAEAEQTRNYCMLSINTFLPVLKEGDWATVEIPALNPWGLLIISEKDNETEKKLLY